MTTNLELRPRRSSLGCFTVPLKVKILERRFAAMGARLTVEDGPWLGAPRIDVRQDSFVLAFTGSGEPAEADVIDVAPADRHLLLLTRSGAEKSKFLCGHDERHWFVAAVPEAARGVSGVAAAKAALAHGIVPADALVLRDEPLTRGRGRPHVMQFVHRRGGDVVYVNRRHPTGISEARYARLTPEQRCSGGWMRLVRDPEVYAKGTVRHPDHATIRLVGWHRVLMNTEQGARAMRHVAFVD
jgi:hypothetical protein